MFDKEEVVFFSKRAEQDLGSIPVIITEKVYRWVKTIEFIGLRQTRLIRGLHDEALKGQRLGQRSVRLNRSYRLIYHHYENSKKVVIEIIEVNKHEY